LRAANGNDRGVRLNHDNSLILTDQRGNIAPINPPPDNPELAVPPGQLLDADIVFDCRSVDISGRLTLETNRGTAGTPDNPYDALPVLTLPLAPERVADNSPVPSASRSSLAPIARSRLSISATTVAATPTITPSAAPETPAVVPAPSPEPAR